MAFCYTIFQTGLIIPDYQFKAFQTSLIAGNADLTSGMKLSLIFQPTMLRRTVKPSLKIFNFNRVAGTYKLAIKVQAKGFILLKPAVKLKAKRIIFTITG
jgi:hypothetical protein